MQEVAIQEVEREGPPSEAVPPPPPPTTTTQEAQSRPNTRPQVDRSASNAGRQPRLGSRWQADVRLEAGDEASEDRGDVLMPQEEMEMEGRDLLGHPTPEEVDEADPLPPTDYMGEFIDRYRFQSAKWKERDEILVTVCNSFGVRSNSSSFAKSSCVSSASNTNRAQVSGSWTSHLSPSSC